MWQRDNIYIVDLLDLDLDSTCIKIESTYICKRFINLTS